MSYPTPQVNYEYMSNDSDDTDDTEELVHEAHWPPDVMGSMSIPPRTNVGNVVNGMYCVNNELVASLEQVGPVMETIHDESRMRTGEIVAVRDFMLAQTQMFTVQTQVLIQLIDKMAGYDTRLRRLEEHQKQSENHEARLMKLEVLHELDSPTSTPRNGEANATASAPRQAPIPILESAPVPMPKPTPSSARAPGVRVRELTGWSKLSVQARGLLRESALARLHHKQNVFRGAIGTEAEWRTQIIPQQLTPAYMALTGYEWPLNAKHTFGIAMWLTRAERANLPGAPARKRPFAVVAGEAPAPAGADTGPLDGEAGVDAGNTSI